PHVAVEPSCRWSDEHGWQAQSGLRLAGEVRGMDMLVEAEDEHEVRPSGAQRRVKFPRHERGGFMWGLVLPQFIVVISAILSIVGLIMLQQLSLALMWSLIAVPVGVVGAITWKGRPLMSRLWSAAKWSARRALGWCGRLTTAAPVAAGAMMLPGVGWVRLSVHATKWCGGILCDARSQRVTAVLKCESQGWALASDADRSERTQGFAKLCAMVAR